MSGFMLHGLGDCTPEFNCGCLEFRKQAIDELNTHEGEPMPQGQGVQAWSEKISDWLVPVFAATLSSFEKSLRKRLAAEILDRIDNPLDPSVDAYHYDGLYEAAELVLGEKIESAVVNVKDFGAKGDGITDDTAAFKAALNEASNRVYVPEGNYNVRAAGAQADDYCSECGRTVEDLYEHRVLAHGWGKENN